MARCAGASSCSRNQFNDSHTSLLTRRRSNRRPLCRMRMSVSGQEAEIPDDFLNIGYNIVYISNTDNNFFGNYFDGESQISRECIPLKCRDYPAPESSSWFSSTSLK
ncbi:hypothetical protein J6590_025658 [Homalodisca vitripennis]|nr:hypothetical protein J6590_025658 [Homalodisca vitripennis]